MRNARAMRRLHVSVSEQVLGAEAHWMMGSGHAVFDFPDKAASSPQPDQPELAMD